MTVKQSIRFRVFERDNFTCVYCGRRPPEIRLEADHKEPRSKGGPDTMENLVTACHECNRGKGATPIAPRIELVSKTRHRHQSQDLPSADWFVLVPRESTDVCETCNETIGVWWHGRVIDRPFPDVFRVQWYSWFMGEATYQSFATVEEVLAQKWVVFDEREDWDAACRGILARHDHAKRLTWADYGESEPPRIHVPHPLLTVG